jgi:hypothetical protein
MFAATIIVSIKYPLKLELYRPKYRVAVKGISAGQDSYTGGQGHTSAAVNTAYLRPAAARRYERFPVSSSPPERKTNLIDHNK